MNTYVVFGKHISSCIVKSQPAVVAIRIVKDRYLSRWPHQLSGVHTALFDIMTVKLGFDNNCSNVFDEADFWWSGGFEISGGFDVTYELLLLLS